jgi:hypothetical protein
MDRLEPQSPVCVSSRGLLSNGTPLPCTRVNKMCIVTLCLFCVEGLRRRRKGQGTIDNTI